MTVQCIIFHVVQFETYKNVNKMYKHHRQVQ